MDEKSVEKEDGKMFVADTKKEDSLYARLGKMATWFLILMLCAPLLEKVSEMYQAMGKDGLASTLLASSIAAYFVGTAGVAVPGIWMIVIQANRYKAAKKH
jgi:hypothetical protein